MRAPLVCLLLALPALAGCFSDDAAPTAPASTAAASAEDAGARSGSAPSAPKDAFVVAAGEEAGQVAYPVALPTNEARPPLTLDMSGEFAPQDCLPGIEMEGVRDGWRNAAFGDQLRVGDVFSYDMVLTYENADDAWAEIHPILGIGNNVQSHREPLREVRGPVVVNFTGQGYRVSEDDMAWWGVGCWYGETTRAIPYTLTLTFTFAEGAVPAEAPILVSPPEGATRLFVRGVPIDAAEPVLSHYRVFGPDDALLCECSLDSNEEADVFELDGAGDLVILVDHTANGFVSFAFDAPPTEDLRALDAEWITYPVYHGDGEAGVQASVTLDIPRVPLLMHAFVMPSEDQRVSVGKKTLVTATNGRGEVLRIGWGGHLAGWAPEIGSDFWFGIWPADWEYFVDHHAYDSGEHAVTVASEGLRGDVILVTRQYVRV